MEKEPAAKPPAIIERNVRFYSSDRRTNLRSILKQQNYQHQGRKAAAAGLTAEKPVALGRLPVH